jgi:hypothetical protein
MSANPRDGRGTAFVRLMGQLSAREQAAVAAMMKQILDGQPAEDSGVEMFVELLGIPPAVARQKIRTALQNSSDWRTDLD